MQRSLWLLSAVSLAALMSACSPNIPQNPQTPYVTVEFNPAASPPVVPSPIDFGVKNPATGLLQIPPSPTDTPTETAFYQSYFDTLDGYPMETPASVAVSADINPASLATGVLVLDITNPAAPAVVPVTATYTSGGADAGGVISIPPPGGMWTRAHSYAVTIIGGNQTGPFAAVTGANGETVTGAQTWALAASTSNCPSVSSCAPPVPVCALPDGGPGGINSGCVPASSLVPAAQAPQLQELQNAATPLLAALAGAPFNIPRANVALSWTFSITSQAEVTFNPPSAIPFPNEIVRTGPNGTISLPIPAGAPPLFAELIGGLNTLNGFSTTATITSAIDFTFPNNGVSALMQGNVDPASLTPQLAIGLNKAFASFGAAASQGDPQWYACLSDVPPGCPSVTATLADGGVKPEVLGIVPQTPLDENTTYIAYMTNAIKDTHQKPVIPSLIFALVRLPASTAPLYANGKSQVPSLGISDSQAQQLGELQAGQAQIFAGLAANNIPYTSVVQAWAFKTQSEVSTLQQLSELPYALPSSYFPSAPLWVEDVTTIVRPQLTALGINTAAVKTIYAGEIVDPFALTGPTGTFNPDGGVAPVPIPFIMTVPTATAPAAGFPVTMFGHGLTGNKTNAYAISNSLASAGQVMIAIDEVWHGARNTCTGFGAYADSASPGGGPLPDGGFPDFAICTTATTAPTDCNAVGRCQLHDRTAVAPCNYGTPTADETCFNLGQNECAPDNHCEGSDFNEAYSGWNLLNLANLFATRDNFRQQVIDNSQFARVATTGLAAVTVPLNGAVLSYSGQSLGGILGTLYTSVAFNVQNAGTRRARWKPGEHPAHLAIVRPAASGFSGRPGRGGHRHQQPHL